MNRGARRQPVFLDDEARALFLSVLAELPRFSVRIHGYALMPNHYHLLVESVTGELPRAMRHVGAEFSRRLNRQNRWDGPLFRGRYHNRLVNSEAYWRHLLMYVHQNPLRAEAGPFDSPLWTSHAAYVGAVPRPDWLTTAELQSSFGSQADYSQYFDSVRDGTATAPEDFDAKRLWAPGSTGAVAVPNLAEPLWQLADALQAVSAVTGQTIEQLQSLAFGPRGNPASWLAAWWLSRHCGIDHGRIAAALASSHAQVSKRIAKVEARRHADPQLRAWIQALADSPRPRKVVYVASGNT